MYQKFDRTIKTIDGITRRYHGYMEDIDRVPWPIEEFPDMVYTVYTQVNGGPLQTAYVIDDHRATNRYRVTFTDGIWDKVTRELTAGTIDDLPDAIDVVVKWIAWGMSIHDRPPVTIQ